MAKKMHLNAFLKGKDSWNQWRFKNLNIEPDLSNADIGQNIAEWRFQKANEYLQYSNSQLNNANLEGTNFLGLKLAHSSFREAKLRNADFMLTDLSFCDFSFSDLSKANFGWSNLYETSLFNSIMHNSELDHADLSNANLLFTDLSGSVLRGTKFISTNLLEADFENTILDRTIFANVDLSKCKGLERVIHEGPSYIDIQTIYRSNGKIPLNFLKGLGIPNDFISYSSAIVSSPIQYFSCFISYCSIDNLFVKKLYQDIKRHGVTCWYAPEELKVGDRIRTKIDESIYLFDKLLLILSEHSVNSQWVDQEVETALARERDSNSNVLFPIRLDDSVLKSKNGWASLIKNTRHIGDFQKWDDENSYNIALNRLLMDLKTKDEI
jgi:uncharacterized protein YjbI with pentapeptide repeats